jgi:5-methylcytosine-specific restriction endonuclease McrA
MDQLTYPCPKCQHLCIVKLTPEKTHYGEIRCPIHGHSWVPKPSEDRKPKRKTNADLINHLPQDRRDFCWSCLRQKELLKSLRPSVSLQVHHVIAVEDNGSDDPENLQLLCAECHSLVHREREKFARYRNP